MNLSIDVTDHSHDDAMAQRYRDDPEYATQMLHSILADGEQAERRIVLRQLASAHA